MERYSLYLCYLGVLDNIAYIQVPPIGYLCSKCGIKKSIEYMWNREHAVSMSLTVL